MEKKVTTIALLLILSFTQLTQAQQITVEPYLQNAEPNSIYIHWETDTGEESTVDWGLTPGLGNSSSGIFSTTVVNTKFHEVQLLGLTRFTTYYYRVKTGAAVSSTFQFKTPPFPTDEESFRIIAMSDMQRDGSNPNKFLEIVQDGIIAYLEDEIGGDLSDNLALIMIPGDLVVTGSNYSQWNNHFFTPGEELFSQVPVYPVLGNHEQNSPYYFQYFNLPDNGPTGAEERTWYKDYGNIRIIGLDSNGSFASQSQLDWMETVLNDAGANPNIDFVFAQLHHPFKSELWLPGEKDYTGLVIELLENFTTTYTKPSIHFFGHTHGYSRGRSLDHKHLWINVATAGGAIDHWGEFPQFDYDEFSVSQDEWGFVTVDVTAGIDPKIVVKRISRGNETTFRDNEITDSLTVRRDPAIINIPISLFPVNTEVSPECLTLKASDFSSAFPIASHGESHWQVSIDCNDFSNPIRESWKNYENFYNNENTQDGDDLTDEIVLNLNENSSYCWRVRYRDRELNWSSWSVPQTFTTGDSPYTDNLLLNPGAENGIDNWTVIEGNLESLTDGECNGISPHTGDRYFAVGGVCDDAPFGRSVQNIDVSAYATDIDAGSFEANFGGYLSNFGGSDLPEMRLLFLDNAANVLGTSITLSTLNNSWTLFNEQEAIPVLTRTIQFEVTGTRNAGNDNDSYFDNLFLKLGEPLTTCDEILSNGESDFRSLKRFIIYPNPWTTRASIPISVNPEQAISIEIVNTAGQKVVCPFTVRNSEIILERGNLVSGLYFFRIKDRVTVLGVGKFILE